MERCLGDVRSYVRVRRDGKIGCWNVLCKDN